MFDEILAQYGTKFLVAALAVLLGLACLALVLWIVRRRPSSPFIRGGRNRQPRLSVLDAAAVDTRRRLVLVRRDDVEHLLMIGGPTDIVVESRIVTTAPAEFPEQAAQGLPQTAVAEPPARPQPGPRVETSPIAAGEHAPPATTQAPEAPIEPRPVVPMPVAAPVAARPAASAPVEPPIPPANRISSMGSVLYGAGLDPSEPPVAPPTRPAPPQEPPFARSVAAPVPPSPVERDAIDALDRARDRVLTSPVGIGSERVAATGDTGRSPASGLPQRAVPDNAALVSEFEKMLEAEIAASPARSANPTGVRIEPAGQQPKTREETEAEMSRLLGELSANRKS